MKQVLKMAFTESRVKFKHSKLMRKLMDDIEEDNELVTRLQQSIIKHKGEIEDLKVAEALQFLVKDCDIQDLPLMWF